MLIKIINDLFAGSFSCEGVDIIAQFSTKPANSHQSGLP